MAVVTVGAGTGQRTSPELTASGCSRLFFCWLTPLLVLGVPALLNGGVKVNGPC
eukprot:SAG31_NODE_8092_length_1524_cov_1.894737_1_plen_53_part_10